MTPNLIRAARALLGWEQSDLAGKAGLTRRTIQAAEAADPRLSVKSADAIRLAFSEAGLALVESADLTGIIRLRK